ncbi:hypothetical protein HPB50_020644 [Hyalomma asiaticum]|uniref:Uncharacterized protein n=1 Tax=Hyalomma asiaticum TaxID=266040 RepID=A0ACB7SDU2_HYAAI|nr:hypothetical protein HPB50_020644 [Hyalomma asiaticum]
MRHPRQGKQESPAGPPSSLPPLSMVATRSDGARQDTQSADTWVYSGDSPQDILSTIAAAKGKLGMLVNCSKQPRSRSSAATTAAIPAQSKQSLPKRPSYTAKQCDFGSMTDKLQLQRLLNGLTSTWLCKHMLVEETILTFEKPTNIIKNAEHVLCRLQECEPQVLAMMGMVKNVLEQI